MKTSVIEVGGLFSALCAQGVEKRLRKLPGVGRVEVSYATGTATVAYDESKIDLQAIKVRIGDCGYHCSGEVLPKHVCGHHNPDASAAVAHSAASHSAHAHHPAAGAQTSAPVRKASADKAGKAHAHGPAPKAAHPEAHAGHAKDEMAHEMGHGAGMDMQAMVRDMRNRFWIGLVFTMPIFVYSPMGARLHPTRRRRSVWSSICGCSSWRARRSSIRVWPFFVAAWRALRNGVLNMAVLVVLSVGTGYLFSVGATFFFGGEQFYEAVAVLLVFILLGHWLEMRARAGASDAIRALMDLAPPMATVLRDGREMEVPTAEVAGRRHRRDPPRQQDPGGRRSDRGRVAGRRVDADRGVDAGGEGRRLTRSSARRSTRAGASATARPRSAPTRRSPRSSSWSRRRRTPRRRRSCWPTRPRSGWW